MSTPTQSTSISGPPLPPKTWRYRLIRLVLILLAVLVSLVIVGRLFGLMMIYHVPSNGMSTEIQSGDHVFVEGLSQLGSDPQRGDVVTFSTKGLDLLDNENSIYVQRVVGLPGEKLEIIDGSLFVDGIETKISNSLGPIIYNLPQRGAGSSTPNNWVIPDGHFFLCGDNTDNSLDSRYFGFVPQENITGRAISRYWPPERVGGVN